jgi:hypothetical protein
MSPIEAALAAIDARGPGEQFSYRQVAKEYGCNRTTLARRHQGVSTSCATKAANQQALYPQQEQELLQYIKVLTQRGLPPTRALIRRLASEIAKRELRKHWVDRYIKRYDVHLISHWATGIDRSRHNADSGVKYRLYFDLLSSKILEYSIEPRHTYNIDEKGFLLGIVTRLKRVFSRRMYKKGRIKEYL